MLDSLADILRDYPTIALFFTVGAGFLIGKIRIGNFSIGSVTAVLLVGVAIGQLNIQMSGPIKMFFFMLFLFSIGYSVGPDFFKSLRGQGAKQALFAVLMSCTCFGTIFVIAHIMGYSKGESVGLFSGSQTCSALLGVGSEVISRLDLPESVRNEQLNIIPVCYAVTYIFGTLGTVIILGNFGPRLLGGLSKVRHQTAQLERMLNNTGSADKDPARITALRAVVYRVYTADSTFFDTPRTVKEVEQYLRNNYREVYVDRLRHGDDISAPRFDVEIAKGDRIVVCGRREAVIGIDALIGTESDDPTLLSYQLERVSIVVTGKEFIGKTLSTIRRNKYMRGVVIRDAVRDGEFLDINLDTEFRRGDRITVVGQPQRVKTAGRHIGHIDRPSVSSDLMFVGLAIAIGGVLGAMSIWIGGVPVSLGTSGGALVAGLVFGWLRALRPTFGHISPGALWIMNNLGLNVFIAVIGIEAAPTFVAGIKSVGPMLLVAGAVGTTIPLLVGLWLGHKVFRFNPAITLGCCAGTRTCTASLGAVQNAIGSTIPAIGYAVTYAVSNILLVIWGLLTVILV
ncbi:MAG: aspartate-alanine antiporter [Bacteroidales bacterium 52_46]|nr:MAG: aspartate-alanine antiporter [Bacteroidales bacterium 52_46]